MTSAINPQFPIHGNPTTGSVRNNFQIAADEISALQIQVAGLLANSPFLPLAGATMNGPIVLAGPPVDDLNPATKAYVDGLLAELQQLQTRIADLEAKA